MIQNKKAKRLTVPKLKEKLDRVFSHYIRLRDSNKDGYCRCISCGTIVFWKEIQNGHYVNRGHMGTRFDEKNCNAQCIRCNMFDEGNNIGYTRGLINKYGIRVISELEAKKHSISKLTPFEYETLIEHYSVEVKRLKAEKGL